MNRTRVEVGETEVTNGDQPLEVDGNQDRLQQECAEGEPHQPAALFALADHVEAQQEKQRDRKSGNRTQKWGGRGFIQWNSPSCRRTQWRCLSKLESLARETGSPGVLSEAYRSPSVSLFAMI